MFFFVYSSQVMVDNLRHFFVCSTFVEVFLNQSCSFTSKNFLNMNLKFRLFLSLFFFVVWNVFSQNVPTTIQKKSILLEEFTGMYCSWCPEGHAIARNLTYASEDAYIIAIHSGSLAVPKSGYSGDTDPLFGHTDPLWVFFQRTKKN